MKVVKPNSHSRCIACGESNLSSHSFGLQFLTDSESSVIAKVTLDERYQGYSQVLHGGVISTLLDAAMTHCLFSKSIEAMTAELNVRFIKSVPINQELEIGAQLSGERRGIYQLTSYISLRGDILARGKAKFLIGKCKLM